MIRLVLIILLVLYHSFAPFVGAWSPLNMQETAPAAYAWIGKASYAFMLETFTFISGFIFGYQVNKKGKEVLSFRNLVSSKFKRLIVPALIFGFIYLLLFKREDYSSPVQAAYAVAQGFAHMWYLPMLFWCFIDVYVIEKTNISPRHAIPCLILLAIMPMVSLPFRLSASAYYMFFFYFGYTIKRYDYSLNRFFRLRWIAIAALAFVVIFGVATSAFLTPPLLFR